jgi:hypothetical protein
MTQTSQTSKPLPFQIQYFPNILTPKGPETIFKLFLKFGQAIVCIYKFGQVIFIKKHDLNCEHVV